MAADAHAFRAQYDATLRQLQFNSKPLIDALTLMAESNPHFAGVVVDAIRDRATRAPPEHRLPLLYLVDSILKNVGGRYTELLARDIGTIFIDGYRIVGEKDRFNFIRVRNTWGAVFPADLLRDLDMRLELLRAGGGGAQAATQRPPSDPRLGMGMGVARDPRMQAVPSPQPPVQPIPPQQPPPQSRPMSAAVREMLLDQQKQILNHIDQLRRTGQLTPEQNVALMRQLQDLMNLLSQAAPTPPVSGGQPATSTPPYANPAAVAMVPAMPVPPIAMPHPAQPAQPYPQMPQMPQMPVVTAPLTAGPMGSEPGPGEKKDVAGLFAKLQQLGLVKQPSRGNSPAPGAGDGPAGKAAPDAVPVPDIELESRALQQRYAGAVESLYENMGLQCVQCGLRFPTDGKDAMQAHMDWHFRTNKRQKEQVKGRMTRKWYMTESEWMVSDDSTETTEEAVPVFFDVADKEKDEEPAEDVSCPVDVEGGKKQGFCDICQESFEKVWSDEHEDWRYKGAIRLPGQIYHKTCYDNADLDTIAECQTPLKQSLAELPRVAPKRPLDDAEDTEPGSKQFKGDPSDANGTPPAPLANGEAAADDR